MNNLIETIKNIMKGMLICGTVVDISMKIIYKYVWSANPHLASMVGQEQVGRIH